MTIEERIEELFELVGDGDLYRYEASEKVVELTDEFAIGFADWIRVCKLKGRSYDFDNIKELLTIYKEEKGL